MIGPIKHNGAVHSLLHQPEGRKLSLDMEKNKLVEAKKRHDVKEERELQFAINARKFHHPKKK